ncbi:leucyl aminopeptidase [SAR92 clade bacterium H455]|uniref:Probable cytosol aminopeptidase n=1 Tax=SAR92 clade bacterium H455 TaxID=2974818 RepID=A0ABY5TVP3_9GAMM|nr:leucyl aminopeptidase [SAR92 clade bacterium H455]
MKLKFAAKASDLIGEKTDCLVVFANSNKRLPTAAASVNKATGGAITDLIKGGDLGTELGSHVLLHNPKGIAAKRLLIVFADKPKLGDRAFMGLAKDAVACCLTAGVNSYSLCLEDISVEDRCIQWQVRIFTETFIKATYRFDTYKSKKPPVPPAVKLTYMVAHKASVTAVKRGLAIGEAIGYGSSLARDLGNTPPNICNPSYLSKQAKAMARGEQSLSVKVLGEKEMDALGMHSLLSVGRGSVQPSQLIVMDYRGGKKGDAPHAIVGKGITFDSGGISLKPGASMDEMKYDMCGAAAVFGALQSVMALNLPINLVCVVAAAENMPSADASRPGDIVTSMSGKTIEILNTDAEGRLVLCDALTYVQKFKPKTIIDLATLTGAVIGALGNEASGLFSNDDGFAKTLINAGQLSGDRVWQLPLWDDYAKQLKSPFADIANLGGPGAGTITAACFLAEFVKDQTWAHLDIAGTAWIKGANKGATGTPVGLLTEYLMGL